MKQPIAVIYKTVYRKKEKFHLVVFEGLIVDDIIDANKRKPLIHNDAEILEIGVGSSFEERYRKKYKIDETIKEDSPQSKVLKELQSIVNEQRSQ